MECPRCHSENNEGSRFCSSCAAPLAQAGPERDLPDKDPRNAHPYPEAGESHRRQVQDRRRGRPGRHGRRLQGRGPQAQALRGLEVPPAPADGFPRAQGALPCRGSGRRGPHPPEHLRHPRGRRERGTPLSSPWSTSRGRHSGTGSGGAAEDRGGPGHRGPDRRRSGRGPPQGHHPPGHQERQHHGHGKGPGQGHGLRAGQAAWRDRR